MAKYSGTKTRRGKLSTKDSYRSQLERDFARSLKERKIEFDYESLKIAYTKEHIYRPDFLVTKKDGGLMIIESKGYFPAADMSKMRAVKKCNPEMDIRFIFSDSKKKNKGSKSNYGEWSKRNGFKFADKTMPSSWRAEI